MKLDLIRPTLEETWGIMLGADSQLIEPGMKRDFGIATDAQPSLVTTASSGIPFWLSTFVDPEVIRVLQAPNAGAEILGEQKEGDWTTQTATFMVVENTGFVGPYGDFNTNGRSDANVTWTNRQSYLFQTIVEYGDLQVDRAGLARLNWVGELQTSAALTLDKFLDFSYHFGIAGLMNYGLLNDPSLPAALVPSVKAAGGSKWINNGAIVATANEIYADIQALILDVVTRSAGLFKEGDAATLVMPPQARVALTATNVYGINVYALLKENYPNLKIVTSYRYATTAGNVVQLWADRFQGNKTGICAFVEKLRDHQIVRDLSAYRQKKTGGTWGAIIRYPVAVSQMLGV